jgi:hypothetical protein
MRYLTAATASALLLVSAVSPAGRAAPGPAALYSVLLAKPIPQSQLPAVFVAEKPRAKPPTAVARAHHVVGDVEIDFNGGRAWVLYGVFRTRGDLIQTLRAEMKKLRSTPGVTVRRSAPGLPSPSWLVTGSTGSVGATLVAFGENNVGILVETTRPHAKAGDTKGALELADAAVRHLQAVERSL